MEQPHTSDIHVLVVEDASDIRELILLLLLREGYTVTPVGTGTEASNLLNKKKYHLIILDWMLPEGSGLELLRYKLQTPNAKTPVLMVTAKGQTQDIILGLNSGADDYLTKPFDPGILIARCKTLLRRIEQTQPSTNTDEITVGQLTIYPDRYKAYCEKNLLELTKFEFKLLLALARHLGKVMTREKLIDLVQGEDIVVVDRTVDTHVFSLRKKLGDCAACIETVRGVGYRMREIS